MINSSCLIESKRDELTEKLLERESRLADTKASLQSAQTRESALKEKLEESSVELKHLGTTLEDQV